MALNDDDQRDDEDVDEFGVPKPRKVLDPETEAIAAEFSGEQTGLPTPANPNLDVNEVMARVNDPSNARLLSQPTTVNRTMPEPTPSGIPGATTREALPEAPKPSTLPAEIPEPAPAPAPAPTSGAKNYDVVEGADQLTWGDTSRLSGFNTNEWGEGGSAGYHDNSVKNTFGKLATRYDPSPDGARQLVSDPDFKRMFPQAVLVDHPTDPKIQFFPDDPPVDVLIKSGEGGWGWQPEGGAGGAGGGGGGGFDQSTTDVNALGESDVLAEIQKALAAYGRGEQPMLDDAISQEFSMKARG